LRESSALHIGNRHSLNALIRLNDMNLLLRDRHPLLRSAHLYRRIRGGRQGSSRKIFCPPQEPYVARNSRMSEPRNWAIRVRHFGGPEELEVVDAPMPTAGRGEIRVRVLASGIEYTDVVIRRHLYAQTMFRRAPFVMGYDVVGEIDQLGDGVSGFQIGDRVADLTVVGSNAAYRILRAKDLVRVPTGVDAAEAAALILSWTTAYQLLHRSARVQRGQRVLVHGAAGAVGQALLVLGKIAGLELWGTARGEHAALVRELDATLIDYQRQDFTRVIPGGFDVVFDGIGEDGFRRSFAALKPGGLLCAYGYTASVQAKSRLRSVLTLLIRVYVWQRVLSWLPGGKRPRMYSINLMRAMHPAWFREDLEALFELLATGAIRPRVAQRISFDEVTEAHRRLEAGGLEGKLVLCPDHPSPRERAPGRRETGMTATEAKRDPAERGWLRYFYRNWRPTRLGRVWSTMFAWVSGLGLTPQILTTLQVRDQDTGRLDSTVLVAANHQDQSYLVSMLGNGSRWVRNVRASDGEAFIKRGQARKVRLTEVPTAQRAPILKAWCQVATSGRKHLPIAPDAPVRAFEAIAADYPVFRIDPA
jgi:NADPH:quinone reductase